MSEQDSYNDTILSRDMLPMLPRSADRLPPMLFVAALFYAMIILGVTFDLGLEAPDSDTTTLEVTIVAETNQRIARPEDADYLAQANQAGRGNTDESVRASAAPEAPAPVAAPAEQTGDLQAEAAPGEEQAARLLTTTEEIVEEMSRSTELSGLQRNILQDFMRQADIVKFAKGHPDRGTMEAAFGTTKQFVEETKRIKEQDD